MLDELFKYPLQSVDYAELDPLVIQAVRAFPTELTERELSDSRLSVHTVDGRRLLNQAATASRPLFGEDRYCASRCVGRGGALPL